MREPTRFTLAFSLLTTVAGAQAVINVPGDQPTIQAGITAAVSGDTVLVAAGTYFESDVDFQGKDITVKSSAGAEATIVDAQGLGRVFLFTSGEGPDAVLRGFTITNGKAPDGAAGIDGLDGSLGTPGAPGTNGGTGSGGGGVLVEFSSPTIDRCIFTANVAGHGGKGGDGGEGGDAISFPLTLSSAGGGGGSGGDGGDGGAVLINGNSPTFTNCLFRGNFPGDAGQGGAGGSGGDGAAGQDASPVFCSPGTPGTDGSNGGDGGDGGNAGSGAAIHVVIGTPQFRNITSASNGPAAFAGAGGTAGAGGIGGPGGAGLASCGIPDYPDGADGVAGTPGADGGPGAGGALSDLSGSLVTNAIFWDNLPDEIAGSPAVSFSNVEGGFAGTGNLSVDPLFAGASDFRLTASSPCIDAGDTTSFPGNVLTPSKTTASVAGGDFVDFGISAGRLGSDLDGNPRIVDDSLTPDTGLGSPVVDMGAYEFGSSPPASAPQYWLLGSLSGTSPGVLSGGILLPLNADVYLAATINDANQGIFIDTLGSLDADGLASARILVPQNPLLDGMTAHHAFVTIDGVLLVPLDVSPPEPLDFVP